MNSAGMDINVNLRELETITCSSCSGKLFTQEYVLKRVPKMMVGAPTDVPVPIPMWRCADCGEVLSEFIPRSAGTFEEIFGKIIE